MLLSAVLMLGTTACQKYDDTAVLDSIKALENRVKALEDAQKQMNSDLTQLKTLVDA